MEKKFKRVSMLSLLELTLRRVAVLLWNSPLNLVSVRNCQFSSSMPWDLPKNWDENVSHALSKLQLPEVLANKIKQMSKPIGLQIIRWKLYHEELLRKAYIKSPDEYFDVPVLEKLQWSAAGAIDYRKTAEELVCSDIFDIVKRYKLACLYCLDHYIPELWEELPKENKINFYSEKAAHITGSHLYYCWPCILKGEEHKLKFIGDDSISFNEFAFQRSSSQGNKAAAEYFLQKLSPEKRENSIISAAKSALTTRSGDVNKYPSFSNSNISDVIFYLLTKMTPEQQAEIFRERPTEVFGCFFDWPWQDVFLDFSDAMWAWMQCEDLDCRSSNYDSLLNKMYLSIQVSDYCLPNLFDNLFMSSPADFRKHFVERECFYGPFFVQLINRQDTETTKVIFSSLDAGGKLRLVFSKHMIEIYCYFIKMGRGDVVEILLRQAELSKEDKVHLKEDLKKLDCEGIEFETPKWRRFFEFLDETDQVKRNSDPETLTKTKKLCCGRK